MFRPDICDSVRAGTSDQLRKPRFERVGARHALLHFSTLTPNMNSKHPSLCPETQQLVTSNYLLDD